MSRRAAATIATLLLAAPALALGASTATATAAAAAKPKSDATLRADLVRLAARAGGSGGFTVLDGPTGRIVAESRGTASRPLGSTAKLLSTAAALRTLGAARPLTTTVAIMAGVDAAGTLGGDLYLVGGGDPTLDEPQLRQLADAVVARGIRTIAGSVVGDESLFDALRGGPATGGAFDLNFAGAVGALTYARGRQAPNGPLQPDPARAAAYRLDDILEARGLAIRGIPKAGIAPAGTAELGRVTSTVGAVVKVIDKQSDDFAAEVLTKALGAAHTGGAPGSGTTANGVAAIKRNLYGLPLRPVDGSGVDPATKGSTRALARFVRRVRTIKALASALPVAGVDGTLAARMRRAPAQRNCRAKTGSLPQSRYSALAGWCRVRGRTLVFALERSHVTSQAAAKAAEDAMVQRIAASRRR